MELGFVMIRLKGLELEVVACTFRSAAYVGHVHTVDAQGVKSLVDTLRTLEVTAHAGAVV